MGNAGCLGLRNVPNEYRDGVRLSVRSGFRSAGGGCLEEGEAVTEFQGVMISIQLLCVVILLAGILVAIVRK
jgi:hypothetical protein